MRRILSAWLAAAVFLTTPSTGRGQDAAPEAAPPATPSLTEVPPQGEPGRPATAPTADGTTSVIAPPSPEPPSSAPPPPAPPPSAGPPPPAQGAPAQSPPVEPSIPSPPPSTLTVPPPSEAVAALESLLEPFKGRLANVGGTLDPQLYARPTPLLEPLARSGDRSRRLWIVQAYWKVAGGYANVRASAEALERLELVAPGSDPHDRATLDVAIAAARADLADARARLGVAQQELVDLARLPFGEPLPWPVDRPLADPYETHFEAIFANRIATGRVRAIVRSLPARHEALASRATAVTAAAKAMAMAEADHAQGKRPIEAVIAAHGALVSQQAAFVEAVRTYNVEIAEYAMAVADLAIPNEQFVSMLIAAPVPWRLQPIEPVSASVAPLPPTIGQPQATAFPPPLAPAVTGIPIE